MNILIVSNNMHIGGVQKSLCDLLCNISSQHNITLLLFGKVGALLKDIPENVEVIAEKSSFKYLGLTKNDVKSSKKLALGRAFYGSLTRLFGRNLAVNLMCLTAKKTKKFDVAISFIHNGPDKLFMGGCNDFVLRFADADRKITFLHCDYSAIGAKTKSNIKQYPRFDVIAPCSEGCRQSFIKNNPYLEDKTTVVPNCHNFEQIEKNACAVTLSQDKINLLTVARLGREKGVSRAVEALSLIGTRKNVFHYYVVGDGTMRSEIERLIKQYALEDTVTLCGEKQNPYGYMKSADLLLIPSISEAAPVVIDEAAFLQTPTLSTETSSAIEMIETRDIGFVCHNSVEGIADALIRIADNPSCIQDKKQNISKIDFNNNAAVNAFNAVVEKGCKNGK